MERLTLVEKINLKHGFIIEKWCQNEFSTNLLSKNRIETSDFSNNRVIIYTIAFNELLFIDPYMVYEYYYVCAVEHDYAHGNLHAKNIKDAEKRISLRNVLAILPIGTAEREIVYY